MADDAQGQSAAETNKASIQNLAMAMATAPEGNPDANDSDPEPPEPTGDETQAEETKAEEPEGQPEPEEALVELEVNGKVYQVPEEIRKGHLREADYTRKTQEVAEQRKAIAAEVEQVQRLKQATQSLAPLFGEMSKAESRLQEIGREYLPGLEQSDPIKAYGLQIEAMNLREQMKNGQGLLTAKLQEIEQFEEQQLAQNLEKTRKEIATLIPDWTPARDKALGESVQKLGLPKSYIKAIVGDPRLVVLLDKAARWDALQDKSKTTAAKVVTLPPVTKPTGRANQSEARVQVDRLQERVKQTGGKDSDARRALLAARLKGM